MQLFYQWFISPTQMKVNLWYIHISDTYHYNILNDLYVKSWEERRRERRLVVCWLSENVLQAWTDIPWSKDLVIWSLLISDYMTLCKSFSLSEFLTSLSVTQEKKKFDFPSNLKNALEELSDMAFHVSLPLKPICIYLSRHSFHSLWKV